MDDFGSAGKAVALCSTHFAVGSNAEGLLFEELDSFEACSCQTGICGRWILSRHICFTKELVGVLAWSRWKCLTLSRLKCVVFLSKSISR